jgi:hypothetical protein
VYFRLVCLYASRYASRTMAGELMEEDQRCPEDLLERPDKGKLNHWLSRFVAEVRNKKGEPYTPRTIVLAGLQR